MFCVLSQVSEVLSLELAGTKTKLEKTVEQSQSLEQTKRIAFQQHELYEQEIKSLEQQIDNMKKVYRIKTIDVTELYPQAIACKDFWCT